MEQFKRRDQSRSRREIRSVILRLGVGEIEQPKLRHWQIPHHGLEGFPPLRLDL